MATTPNMMITQTSNIMTILRGTSVDQCVHQTLTVSGVCVSVTRATLNAGVNVGQIPPRQQNRRTEKERELSVGGISGVSDTGTSTWSVRRPEEGRKVATLALRHVSVGKIWHGI